MEDKDYVTKEIVNLIFKMRQKRLLHPHGTFDGKKRWWPDETEECVHCEDVRSPSAAYPFSKMTHCRSRKHIKELVFENELSTCSGLSGFFSPQEIQAIADYETGRD